MPIYCSDLIFFFACVAVQITGLNATSQVWLVRGQVTFDGDRNVVLIQMIQLDASLR